MKRTVREKCGYCKGDGRIFDFYEYPEEGQWEEAPCPACDGFGYRDVPVNDQGMPI